MNTREAYNLWAAQYDSNQNKTRDLEAIALRVTLADKHFLNCLEIGCGTGKNTKWLLSVTKSITAVDLSEEMLAMAKAKLSLEQVRFTQADITEEWHFGSEQYDLLTFSLVLEHIEQLDPIFEKAAKALAPGGLLYLGELHPYKQYQGTKARFDTEAGRHIVTCFNHHVSDFVLAAKKAGLSLVSLQEFFDDDNRENHPRILCLVFRK